MKNTLVVSKVEKRISIGCVLSSFYTCFVLLAAGTALGAISLYFGAAGFLMPMFKSYFKVPYLAVLNILPVVFLIFLLYFIFNRVWVSFLVTSLLTLALTWANYFKLLFRNDPLLAPDLLLFSEAVNMSGKYHVQPNWKIICVLIACIVGTLAAAFLAKGKIRKPGLRIAGIVLLLAVAYFSFPRLYLNEKLYNSTQNYKLINQWSSTQVYISRGFLYPFLYSIGTGIDTEPAGYDRKAAEEKLYSYTYSNIPANKKVNVIGIMLEAYNDLSKFKELQFNVDVYGYLHQLQKESYSGELVTNIFAGGTVDTERSFLTGYTTVPNFRTDVNSYVRYFAEQGYTVEGSHPCYSWFYNRANVNQYLGFNNYYFFERYYSLLANGGIAGDRILFPQIEKLYEENKKTGKPYFSFNVTYQGHGPYSTQKKTDVQYVRNTGYADGEYNIINNYFKSIEDTNRQLKTLFDYFRVQKEPVVVILFGDHNPWMGDNNSVYKKMGLNFDLGTGEGFYNYYCAPYVIWANDSAKATLGNSFSGKGSRIGPYFLMNEFFKLAGYEGNEYMKLSNDLMKTVDVVHRKNYYQESSTWTTRLSLQAQKKLDEFLKVQYYWRRNFRSEPR